MSIKNLVINKETDPTSVNPETDVEQGRGMPIFNEAMAKASPEGQVSKSVSFEGALETFQSNKEEAELRKQNYYNIDWSQGIAEGKSFREIEDEHHIGSPETRYMNPEGNNGSLTLEASLLAFNSQNNIENSDEKDKE